MTSEIENGHKAPNGAEMKQKTGMAARGIAGRSIASRSIAGLLAAALLFSACGAVEAAKEPTPTSASSVDTEASLSLEENLEEGNAAVTSDGASAESLSQEDAPSDTAMEDAGEENTAVTDPAEEETLLTPAELPWSIEDLEKLGEDVPEGARMPDYFSFSGGTGRASISCLYLADHSVLEQLFSLTADDVLPGEDDGMYAMIRFDSSHYDYYTIDGLTYYTAHGEDSSYALVPAPINRNIDLTGMTTAMSAGHEITYQIYIGCAEEGSGISAVTTAGDTYDVLDDAPPLITGLPEEGELVAESGLLRIFSYGNEGHLIELDTGMADRFEELAEERMQERSPYLRPVIKYLLVSEDMEIPAGMEKLLVVVKLPAESIYSDSDAAHAAIQDLVSEDRLKTGDGLPDYRSLISDHTDLLLAGGVWLPDEPEEGETWLELADTMTTLGIPMFIDRSADDPAEEADQIWLNAYKLLLS